MSNPLISIITVTYNAEKFIESTIKSVLAQSYDNVEYIVVDGESTDGTLAIIDRYKDKISLIVSEPDTGLYDAMNKGIAFSHGDAIGILNAGDFYLPDTLEVVSVYFKDRADVIVTGNMRKFNDTGVSFFNVRNEKNLLTADEAMPLNHPATFVGGSVYGSVGVFDTSYKICADCDFILRAVRQSIEIIFLDKVLAEMELGGVSEKFSSLKLRTKEHYMIRKNNNCRLVVNIFKSLKYIFKHSLRYFMKLILPSTIMEKYYKQKSVPAKC